MVAVRWVPHFAGAYQVRYVSHGLFISQSRVWPTEETDLVQGQALDLRA